MGATATAAAAPEAQDGTPGGRPSADHQRDALGHPDRRPLA